MKVRGTTLIENIMPNPHTYLVTIGTDIGQFTGVAVCREEDYPYESEYHGYELAEMKATIEYARAKRKYYDAKLKALTEFWREMSDTRTYNARDFWVKKIRVAVDRADFNRMMWANRVDTLKEKYYEKIKSFDTASRRKG